MADQRTVDALLDAYGRYLRALMVLHFEADTDLEFDHWVSLADMRYLPAIKSFEELTDESV